MFLNGDDIWINKLIDSVVTYDNNTHRIVKKISVVASNQNVILAASN